MRTCKKCGAKPEAIGGNMYVQQFRAGEMQYTEPVTVRYCNKPDCKLSKMANEHLDATCSKCGWAGAIMCLETEVQGG